MTRLPVHAFAISIDGYRAGSHQDLQNPLGAGGLALHEWVFEGIAPAIPIRPSGRVVAAATSSRRGR
jgi:hypothetical protein